MKADKKQSIYIFIVILISVTLNQIFPSRAWYYLMMYLMITSEFLFKNPSRKESALLIFGTPVVIVIINLLFYGTFY
ncbi:hypothetical protein GCM10008986_24900 [Salinibacillus aidingensis]|uniref:YoqO-like protein n=1 Tax=Salinibacillus aidingensis TaxID=237684 RepID=A0ABN1BFN9_9BACI